MGCCYCQIALGSVGVSISLRMNSFVFRAEQPMAPDLSYRSIRGGSSSSSGNRDLVFIVNPQGANGRTGKEWKKLLPHLRTRLSRDYNIYESLTSGPSHATEITREAVREGANTVIAVGGDGTLHEVVNGFFTGGKPVTNRSKEITHSTALGLIPLGTGSDFARTFGWNNDPYEAIERIAKGLRSRIDVGFISRENGESHYFINVADIHLSAKAGFFSSRYKRFGNLCYVIGALQAFMSHHNQDLKVKVDDGKWEVLSQVTALCIGNGKYFGGGMKITPNADPRSGNFEVLVLQNFKWYDFVTKLDKLYNGTHLSVENVCSRSGTHSLTSLLARFISDTGLILDVEGSSDLDATFLCVFQSQTVENNEGKASCSSSNTIVTDCTRICNSPCCFQKNGAYSIEVEEMCGNGDVYVQSDGEHLGFLPMKFTVLPAAVEIIC